MTLNLENVTICAIDSVMPELALLALKKSLALSSYGNALLFSDQYLDCGVDVQLIKINKLNSLQDYSRFLMKELYQYINTPYALIVQWDGYVVDQSAWTDEFFGFDYIGAKWPWHQDGRIVGNGGFSLRSKKLFDAVASPQISFIPDLPEDDQICRVHRTTLEKEFDIKFADEVFADRFSYERSAPDRPSFGFHGIFNIWRYLDDEEIEGFSDEFSDSIYSTAGFYEYFLQYFLLRKFKPLKILYTKLSKKRTQQEILENIVKVTKDEKFAVLFLDLCNKSLLRK